LAEATSIKNEIFFSIVVPTYNRGDLIAKTIGSLLAQEHQGFEILVIDDGSTDDTEDVIKNINSQKIVYHKIKNSERGFARNYGARLAKGDYINFFDSDDLALPNHLSVARKTILTKNFPEVFHLDYEVKNTDSSLEKSNIGKAELANGKLLHGNILSCNGVFLKKEIALQFPFRELRTLSASEDWDLWLRLSVRYQIHLIPEVTSYIVNHQQRSVMMFNEESSLSRTNELIESIKSDEIFISTYPGAINIIKAHMLSYMSLHAAMAGHKKRAFRYLVSSLKVNFKELFTRRFLAIIKHLVF
jgi:glycosyltransferase involved in cell wall biosynthesis